MKKMTPAFVAALFALSACGGGSSANDAADAGSEDSMDSAPKCSEVWVTGETLPTDYEGCMDGDTMVDNSFTPCKDGKRSLYVHQTATGENTHFALTGEAIQEYTDEAKSKAYFECQPA